MKIVGVGRYLPERIVLNSEVERILGLPEGSIDNTHAGVKQRRWAVDETSSYMAYKAAVEALEEAGLTIGDVDLILNGSGTQEQAIPDTGPLIQRHFGKEADGIPAHSVHATCLSFLVALNAAANYLATGQHKTILVTAADIASCGLNKNEPEAFVLFGDAVAAAVVTRTPEGESAGLNAYVFQTFGEGAYHTAIMGGGSRRHPNRPDVAPEENLFHMDGKEVYLLAVQHAPKTLAMLRRSLLVKGLQDIQAVIPHQASGLALEAMHKRLGWPLEKIVVTIDTLGNTIGASIPCTLYKAIREQRIQRGREFMIFGTGAGLSIGAAILTY